MFLKRLYERNDLYTTHISYNYSQKSSIISNLSRGLNLFLFLASNSNVVAGTPLQSDYYGLLKKRDASSNSSNVSPKVMVAIAIGVIAFLLLSASAVAWRRRALRGPLNSFSLFSSASVAAPMGGATAARELTAEQLAGTINGDLQPGNTNAAPRTTRRSRRPRRTPSQMSVTSLPAYNKEPGEEELVIFRGRDMEDATMPTATAMTALDEEQDGSSFSNEDSQHSRYSPMPASPNNMPLLQDDSAHGDLSLQSIPDVLPHQEQRNSLSSHETSSLMRTNSNLPDDSPDPRGDAPAYYEVVDPNDRQNNGSPAANVRRQPSNASSNPPGSNPNRRSGFRTLLNRMSLASGPQNHNRNASVNSAFSSNMSHTLEPSTSRISGHRSNNSGGSGSLLSGSMFRTLSRQKSNHTLNSNRLNSPSLISLNSISSPLTHTATRTEFTYPKSGPTAEQLKMISSRESIVRFGVPYGADAIAYASSSRLDLAPPPDFETTVEPQVPRPGASAGPSRLRSMSNLQPSSEVTPANRNSTIDNNPVPSSSSSSSSPSPPATDENKPSTDIVSDTAPAPAAESASSEPSHQKPLSESGSSLSAGANSAETDNAGSLNSLPHSTTLPTTIPKTQPVSEFGKLNIPPPSSYHDYTASSTRSESRASIFTYATAAESLSPSHSGQDSANEEFFSEAEYDYDSAPSTPRLGARHELEMTDTTIMQDPRRDTIIASGSSPS